MKKLNLSMACECIYNSSIEVPDDMTLEEAITYAKEHIDEIPLGPMTYVPDSDSVDEELCEFEQE